MVSNWAPPSPVFSVFDQRKNRKRPLKSDQLTFRPGFPRFGRQCAIAGRGDGGLRPAGKEGGPETCIRAPDQ